VRYKIICFPGLSFTVGNKDLVMWSTVMRIKVIV
jgi:hypothetical protein